jgi:predicted aspartyl protease
VGGQPAQLIVDTGATDHVIAGWVAREIGAQAPRPAGSATAHGGETVALGRIDGVGITLAGFGRVNAPSLLVTEVPADVRRRGVGGVISPQALVAEGRGVIIDLVHGELVEGEAPVVRDALEALGTRPVAVQRCAAPGAGVLVVEATVEGEQVGLQLDTGSTTSSVGRSTPLGQRLGRLKTGQSTQITASGIHTVATVPSARVELGPHASELSLDLTARAPAGGCGQGYAGMDVLRSCVLLITRDDTRLSCRPRSP